MRCDYQKQEVLNNGVYIHKCSRCGDVRQSKYLAHLLHRVCPMSPKMITRNYQTGDQLHELLYDRFGVDMTLTCACKAWIIKMNEGGPEWCRENVQKIVGKMLSEAKQRNWELKGRPLLSKVARIGTILPWGMAFARVWARELVLEAIELSERGASDEEAD